MQTKDIKTLFLDQYKGLEKVGPFRKREIEEGNKKLELIGALADRWRRVPDTDGKRLVSKILSLYDEKNPLIDSVLKDNPISFEQAYQESGKQHSRIYWLEVACLCGRENLVKHLINTSEDAKSCPDLLAFGLSTGDALFSYRLATLLKEKNAIHQECLNLYNKCSFLDLKNIKSLMESKQSEETGHLQNTM